MLIEQVIEFQLKGPRPPGVTCTAVTVYFHDKTKVSKKKLRVDYHLLLKYCTRHCALLSSIWAKSLTKFNTKMQNLKLALDLNC